MSLESFCYGRLSPDYSKPRLWVEDYMTEEPPTPVYPMNRLTPIKSWPMYLNDQLGDCTIAAYGHMVGAWTQLTYENEIIFSNAGVTSFYSLCGGHVPGRPNTDQGCVMGTVLQNGVTTGLLDQRGTAHKLAGYAQLSLANMNNPAYLNWALKNFGTVYVGINCPQSAETQYSNGQPWTYVPGSPNAGGHCIPLQQMVAGEFPYQFITWGAVQSANQQFVNMYVEEAWVPIGYDWLKAGKTITGVNQAQLVQDSQTLAA
jgi:hypothetical protein